MTHDDSRPKPAPQCFWGSRYSLGLVLLGAIAAYFLLAEHRAHVLGALPLLLLLLACPLIHMFMHRGHAGHGGHVEDEHRENRPPGSAASTTPPQHGGKS